MKFTYVGAADAVVLSTSDSGRRGAAGKARVGTLSTTAVARNPGGR